MENCSIYHSGVKGMKWGVRRYQNADGTLTDAGKKRYSSKPDAKKLADEKKKAEMKDAAKNRRTLSDADIKKRIERIKLEKQLKDLTDEELTPGKKAVKEILSSSGKKVANAVITGAVLYGVKAAMTKKFDIAEAAGYMTPKPKNK